MVCLLYGNEQPLCDLLSGLDRAPGRSGLGLEAQRVDAARLMASRAESVEIASYMEVETGKNSARPELAKAIAHAKLANATLIVAKVDRLARNLAFISALMESKVKFVCCDCPTADDLHIHIMAAFAQHEAKMISERTTKALAAAKARGVRLGSKQPGRWLDKANGWAVAQAKSVVVRREQTRKVYEDLLPLLKQLRDEGRTTIEISAVLNQRGYQTGAGKPFTFPAVWRLLKRYLGSEYAGRPQKSPVLA